MGVARGALAGYGKSLAPASTHVHGAPLDCRGGNFLAVTRKRGHGDTRDGATATGAAPRSATGPQHAAQPQARSTRLTVPRRPSPRRPTARTRVRAPRCSQAPRAVVLNGALASRTSTSR